MAPRATCATDRECGFALRCFEFHCVDKRTCESDLECLAGTRCIKSPSTSATGLCVALQTCVPGCPQGKRCAADLRCIDPEACGSDLDCRAEERCEFGNCRVTTCSDDRECAPDRVCTPAGTCLAQRTCVWDQHCPRDLLCQDGTCQIAPTCPACASDEICINGHCLPTSGEMDAFDPDMMSTASEEPSQP